MKKRERSRGFTLVELIVVLVILAILAAILIPSLSGYADKARERAVLAEARALVLAAQTLASEQYAQGDFQGSGFLQSNRNDILQLAEASAGTSITRLSFYPGGPTVQRLTCRIDKYTVLYDADADVKYTVTETSYAGDAGGYWDYAHGAAADGSVTGAGSNDKKTKALQALFIQQFGEDGRGLSAEEAALFTEIGAKGPSSDPAKFSWLPTYAKDGSILLIATAQTYSSSKSNYSASLIYYEGDYYYYYGNKYQIPGSDYVGDQTFDTGKLTGAVTQGQLAPDAAAGWVKID